MEILPCVLVGIFRDGRLLLLKRNREPFAGLWSLVGGKLHDGETMEECALREAREETGLAARFVSLKGVAFSLPIGPRGGGGSIDITPELALFALFFSAIIGMVAGYIPARQAASLKPLEALRYE